MNSFTRIRQHIGLRDHAAAFAALEQSRAAGNPRLTENDPDLIFDPPRQDPRWKQLLSRRRIP